MWDVLKDYPAARVRLEAIAVKRLEKYRKEPLKKSKFESNGRYLSFCDINNNFFFLSIFANQLQWVEVVVHQVW